MANGFGSFYVGSSGLKNSQNALNTTANNMANVNTTGYVFPYRMWHMSGIYS